MRERSRAMRIRVLSRLAAESFSQHDLNLIDTSLSATLSMRDAVLADDHDVDLLHPARTLLILIDDAGVRDPDVLCAGAYLESERSDLRVMPETRDPADVMLEIATPLTCPDPGRLLEALLALPVGHAQIAIAERLDHARHLHLRPREMWPSRLALENEVYLPLSSRLPGLMARRYARWHASFLARRS